MEIGFGAPVSGAWATPGDLASFGGRAEEAGYASLWTFQRLLIPAGSRLEPVYQSVLDPLVALGFLAARTSRIRLGVALINMPFVSPGYLAKQATTIDVLSGGRLDLGLGIGWMPEEFTLTGASMARRGARAEEYLAVLRGLWGGSPGGPARFDGDFYTVQAAGSPGTRAAAGAPGPPGRHVPGRDGTGRADRRRLDDLQPGRPVPHQRRHQSGPDRCRGGRARPGPDPHRLPGGGPAREEVRSRETGERLPLSGSYPQIRADSRSASTA